MCVCVCCAFFPDAAMQMQAVPPCCCGSFFFDAENEACRRAVWVAAKKAPDMDPTPLLTLLPAVMWSLRAGYTDILTPALPQLL